MKRLVTRPKCCGSLSDRCGDGSAEAGTRTEVPAGQQVARQAAEES